MRSIRRMPIVWTEAKVLFEDPQGLKGMWLAICGESKRTFRIAPRGALIYPLLLRDIYITDDRCEEAQRCLDFDCPLNRTTKQSFAAAEGVKVSLLPEKFGETLNVNKGPQGQLNDFSEWVTEEPRSILARRRRQ